jgi:endonuclease G
VPVADIAALTGVDVGALAGADVLTTRAVRPGEWRLLQGTDDIVL